MNAKLCKESLPAVVINGLWEVSKEGSNPEIKLAGLTHSRVSEETHGLESCEGAHTDIQKQN